MITVFIKQKAKINRWTVRDSCSYIGMVSFATNANLRLVAWNHR